MHICKKKKSCWSGFSDVNVWGGCACVCVDKKCPFTGLVSIRGRILSGTVVSTKMHRTIIIRRDYLHYIPKYNRYEKRHSNLAAHISPAFRVEDGDQVTVGQCRPLSKTVGNPLVPLMLELGVVMGFRYLGNGG